MATIHNNARLKFIFIGTCSHTMFYLLNHETGLRVCDEERASEVIKKAGGNNKEAVLAAGFAGGIGLSGNACGALGAAIWYKTLHWCRNNPKKTPPFFKNPEIKSILEQHELLTNKEYNCKTISGQTFKTPDEHSHYIVNGGCQKRISILAELCKKVN